MVAGVDVGGSTTKACIVSGASPVATAVIPTAVGDPSDLGTLVLAAVETAVSEVDRRIGDLSRIVVGIPGQVSKGWVRNAANLGIDEDGFDLQTHVSTTTGLPTAIENDMTVAAYGAFRQLSTVEPALQNLVYVGLGTGVAAGVVLNGEVFKGSRSLAGEFGHVPMGTGVACACGSTGCLESVVGANALSQAWDGEMATTLFSAAERGESEAVRVVDRAMDHLAVAMWWLAVCYDPDYFLIGGGVGANNPSIKDLIASRWAGMSAGSALAQRVLDPDRIRISDLEEPVGAYGAALLAAGSSANPNETSPMSSLERERST